MKIWDDLVRDDPKAHAANIADQAWVVLVGFVEDALQMRIAQKLGLLLDQCGKASFAVDLIRRKPGRRENVREDHQGA